MIETLGRRPMFIWGSVGQAASMFLASFCLIPYNELGDISNTAVYGAVVGLFLFLITFGCTWLMVRPSLLYIAAIIDALSLFLPNLKAAVVVRGRNQPPSYTHAGKCCLYYDKLVSHLFENISQCYLTWPRLWNFAVVMWTPPMLNSIGGFGTFLFFGVINICFIPIMYLFYPGMKATDSRSTFKL